MSHFYVQAEILLCFVGRMLIFTVQFTAIVFKGEKELLQVHIQYSSSSPFMSVCWERLYLKHIQEKVKFKVSQLN